MTHRPEEGCSETKKDVLTRRSSVCKNKYRSGTRDIIGAAV